jgi:hypothetical protein
MAPGNIWVSFGTDGVEGDVYAAELTRNSTISAVIENVQRESVSRSLSWVLEAPYSLTTSTENLTSVATSYATILEAVLAGSGSGVIADLSAATGGDSGGALLTFSGGTSMAWGSKRGYGFTFTLSANKRVKGVGFYDENLNGLNGSYYFMLLNSTVDPSYPNQAFDSANTIAEMEVPSGTTATLSGSWRRVDLTTQGALLTAGITYTLFCDTIDPSNVDNLIKNASDVTMLANTSFGQNYSWDTEYSPSTTSGDGTAYFGPMIFFE